MQASIAQISEKIGFAIVALVSAVLVAIAVLNVFYVEGDLIDGGWLATLVWHGNFSLIGPPSFSLTFFSEHMVFIFWPLSLISYLTPLSKFDFYALFQGCIYALYAAGIFRAWLLVDPEKRASVFKTITAACAAFAATFSVVGMQALRLPHFEMAMPPLALWFFIEVTQKNYRHAAIWFVLCLMVREDAGFHLFGIMFLVQIVSSISHKDYDQKRMLWRFAAWAFLYSLIICILKNVLFVDADDDVFRRSYTGTPPWHHVNAEFIAQRWDFYKSYATFIYIPCAITAVWALIVRNPFLPIGYLAFIPWVVLSFFSVNDASGTMTYYYAFPFWISLSWPLIALRLWSVPTKKYVHQIAYGLILISSLFAWDYQYDQVALMPLAHNNFPHYPFQITDGLKNRAATDEFVSYFVKHQTDFKANGLGLDMSLLALLTDYVRRDTWLETIRSAEAKPDILIYYENCFEWGTQVLPLLKTGLYNYFYQVPGTPIRIAARHDLAVRLPVPQPFEAMEQINY